MIRIVIAIVRTHTHKHTHTHTHTHTPPIVYTSPLQAGLQYCHSQRLIVRDLRPATILVDNGWVKIGDLSRVCRTPLDKIKLNGMIYKRIMCDVDAFVYASTR